MTRYTLLLALAFLSLAGCKEKKSTTDSDQPSIQETVAAYEVLRYRKTPCFGICPHFEMVVMSDGQATFNGERNVEMVGTWKGTWNQKQIGRVIKEANRIGYKNLQDEYDNKFVTDLPATYTTINFDGSGDVKTIMNRYQGPAELQSLYKVIDEIILEVEWTPLRDN